MDSPEYKFEVFTGRSTHSDIIPYVTFMSSGSKISLNQSAYTSLGSPEYVQFLFDRKQRVMGLQASEKSKSYAYKVQKSANANSYAVTAVAFIEYAGIKSAVSKRYQAKLIKGVLAVELNGPSEEVNRGPKRKNMPIDLSKTADVEITVGVPVRKKMAAL